MYFFDYVSVARDAGISDEDLEHIRRGVRREFPDDEMMYELHVMRACDAVKEGLVSLAAMKAALAKPGDARSA